MRFIILFVVVVSLLTSGCFLSKYQSAQNTGSNIVNNNVLPPGPTDVKLDLSNRGLTKIPDYVFVETGLESLDVSGNKLTGAIPSEIGRLSNLKILKANNNQMTGVPAEIGQLKSLEILDLSNNQLTGLPYELGKLQNLKTLNISGNKYSQLDFDIIKNKLPASVEVIR